MASSTLENTGAVQGVLSSDAAEGGRAAAEGVAAFGQEASKAEFDWASFAPESIAYFSDLHLESPKASFQLDPALGADLIILCGDIHTKARAAAWAKSLGKPCILILGNHDHYDKTLGGAARSAKEDAEGSMVAVLDNNALELANLRILGTTLWTDYKLMGDAPHAMRTAEANLRDPYASGMMDHRKIRTASFSKARAANFASEHAKARRFLREELDKPCDKPTLVMTHHAPSEKSMSGLARIVDNPFDACYASNVEDLMGADKVQAWVHGHVHKSSRYFVDGTLVACNPLGYVGEPDTGFNPLAKIFVADLAAARRNALNALEPHLPEGVESLGKPKHRP